MVEVPEEVCDLNPQKTCRFTTKLVPKLTPKEECSVVPRETCHLRFSSPVAGKKPLVTKWCMDDDNDILNRLEQAGGARLKANVDPDNSKSILGLGLVPPTEGFSTKISATGLILRGGNYYDENIRLLLRWLRFPRRCAT